MAATRIGNVIPSDALKIALVHDTWQIRYFPKSAKPYVELVRLHKPAGIAMFYFSCLYGTFLVGLLRPGIGLKSIILANAKLLLLSFLLRGALCTWNDILDQDFDRQVERTRVRPIARCDVSIVNAGTFTLVQATLIAACFRYILPNCFVYRIPFLGLHIFYPFTKRYTNHPQIILGFAHSYSIFISFPVLRRSLSINFSADIQLKAAIFFCLAVVF